MKFIPFKKKHIQVKTLFSRECDSTLYLETWQLSAQKSNKIVGFLNSSGNVLLQFPSSILIP